MSLDINTLPHNHPVDLSYDLKFGTDVAIV